MLRWPWWPRPDFPGNWRVFQHTRNRDSRRASDWFALCGASLPSTLFELRSLRSGCTGRARMCSARGRAVASDLRNHPQPVRSPGSVQAARSPQLHQPSTRTCHNDRAATWLAGRRQSNGPRLKLCVLIRNILKCYINFGCFLPNRKRNAKYM